MFQKFFHWIERRAAARPVWMSAVLTALLVHLLLLGLFRYAPQPRRAEAGALAPMMTLDLAARENADLRHWVEYHDPAVMTAADSPYGYSQIVREAPFRAAVEDLPRPPQLAKPGAHPAPRLDRKTWNAPYRSPILGVISPTVRRRPAAAPVQVYFNGRAVPELAGRLAKRYRAMPDVVRPKRATEIAALPMAGRFRLETGSGNAALDRLALYELKLWSGRRQTAADDGVFTVAWGEVPEEGAKR